LENNSRKPRDLTKNRHNDSLKVNLLFLRVWGIREFAVDDDDDAMRTNVSQPE
jgi:hypothetical protein